MFNIIEKSTVNSVIGGKVATTLPGAVGIAKKPIAKKKDGSQQDRPQAAKNK